MTEQYDDDKPTHRWVRIGYAKTPEGQIDKARIGKPEQMTAADAKRLVDNNHGVYLTDEQVAELDAVSSEGSEAAGKPAKANRPKVAREQQTTEPDGPPVTPPDVPAPSGKAPANLRTQGWGAKPDGTSTTTTSEGN